MLQQLFLHFVERLNYFTLVEVLLYLVLSGHFRGEHRVNEVLEYLPEEEEVVALGYDEFHLQVRPSCIPRPRLVVKLLQAVLVLLRNRLVHFEHCQHEVFNLLDSDHLESLVKQLDHIGRRTRVDLVRPVVDLDAHIGVSLSFENV